MSTTTLNMYTVAATIPLTTPTNTISFPVAYIIAVYREHTYETSFRDQSTGTKEKGQKDQRSNTVQRSLTFDFSPPSRKPRQSPVIEERHTQRDGEEIEEIVVSSQNDTHLKKYLWRGTRKGHWNSVCVCTVQSLAYKTSSQQNIYQLGTIPSNELRSQ